MSDRKVTEAIEVVRSYLKKGSLKVTAGMLQNILISEAEQRNFAEKESPTEFRCFKVCALWLCSLYRRSVLILSQVGSIFSTTQPRDIYQRKIEKFVMYLINCSHISALLHLSLSLRASERDRGRKEKTKSSNIYGSYQKTESVSGEKLS